MSDELNTEEILQQASDALDDAIKEKKRNQDLIKSLGPAIIDALKPALESLAEHSRLTKEDIKSAISEVVFNLPEINVPKPEVTVNIPEIKVPKAQVDVSIPEIKLPVIKIPPIKVPKPEVTVNIPPFDFPEYKTPIIKFPEIINLGYDHKNPLPVNVINQVSAVRVVGLNTSDPYFDAQGFLKVNVAAGTLTVGAITGITNSIQAAIIDSSGVQYSGSNPIPVTGSFSATLAAAIGQGDGAAALRIIQAGDSVSSVIVNNIINSVQVALVDSSGVQYSGSNPLPTTASVTLSAAIGQGDSASALRIVIAGNSDSSVVVNSGTLTNITNSLQVTLVDSSGVGYSGSNPLPTTASVTLSAATGQGDTASALRVVHAGDSATSVATQAQGLNETTAGVLRTVIMTDSVTSVVVNSGTLTTVSTLTGITNSVATVLTDSSGVAYSGSNPLPTTASLSASSIQVQDGQGSIITSHPGSVDHRGLDVAIIDASGNQITSFGGGTQYLSTDDAGGVGTGTLAIGVMSSTATGLTTKELGWTLGLYDTNNALYVNNAYSLDPVNDSITVYMAGATVASTVVNSGTLTGITNSLQVALVDSTGVQYSGSNPLPTTATATLSAATGQGDAASALRIVIAGNSDSSVVVNSGTLTGVTNSIQTVLVDSTGVAYSGSNPVPTSGSATLSAAIGQGDSASALRIVIAGNSDSSVVVNSGTLTNLQQFNGNTPAQGLNETTAGVLRVVMMTDSNSSVSATQVGTWNIGTVTTLTGVTNSIQSSLIDSGGVGYSGSNPVPVTIVSGGNTSTLTVGDSAARSADNGGNPVKIGGIARVTNPTAFSDGDRSNLSTDKLGRALTTPLQMRQLRTTAYATLGGATGSNTETTLIAGVASTFLDLIYVTFANSSTNAVSVDLRQGTGGAIIGTVNIPASATQGFSLQAPIPMTELAQAWTVKINSDTGTDLSNTKVYVTGLFSQEI